ncbi:MAG: hypothetical protein IJA97_03450 [Clostridia bacterium]|nr:hypothetical protein [Clostridia bacterium]
MINYHKENKSINLQAPRCYYVPFSVDQNKSYDRVNSNRFYSLNGKWLVKEHECFEDAENFLIDSFDKEITVPSCLQYYGFDNFQYTNQKFPFPIDIPHVPSKNPVYHYRRSFNLDNLNGEKLYFVTEGVDSCYYLYVNSKFVGFTDISHKLSEFDITDFVFEGENQIDILVVKWCAGSYLEDQDKWRFTGIFRDVYLLKRVPEHITDYKIETDIINSAGTITVTNLSNVEFSATVLGETQNVKIGKNSVFTVKNAKFWSAENPNLYELEIECNGEIIYTRVGIRTSKIENGIYLFNGKPIKLRGVNRHDFTSDRGATISIDEIYSDLMLLKSMNVNAIRTSHYPSCPEFYELCDELGFYVMSESDIEAHGGRFLNTHKDITEDEAMSIIPNYFADAILERQKFNYHNNKNATCVCIWSFGNESGWGKGFELAADYFHSNDTRPVQYESVRCYPWKVWTEFHDNEFYNNAPVDFDSVMYPGIKWAEDYYFNGKEKRPLVYCEYAHAMGNGPGGLSSYWDVIERHDSMVGGFIWEFCNHGVSYGGKNERYGGDFGEFYNDGNFCMDGIFNTDRSIKAGTLEMKKVYQPITFKRDSGNLEVFNKNYFESAVGTIKIVQGLEIIEKSILIEPRKSVVIACNKTGNLYVEFIKDGEITACAHEQFYVDKFKATKKIETSVKFNNGNRYIVVTAGEKVYSVDKISGKIVNFTANGNNYGEIDFNTYRAPIDNDRFYYQKWVEYGLDAPQSNVTSYEIFDNAITFDISLSRGAYVPFLKGKVRYSFYENGVSISLDYQLQKCVYGSESGYFNYFPRVGLKIKLDKEYSNVKYLGYGNGETYPDLYSYAVKKEYTSTVEKQYYNYYKPQECGAHYLTDYVEISSENAKIRVEGMQSFSAIPYSRETLASCKHYDELPISDGTYLSLDYFTSGLGSASCGSIPTEDVRVPVKAKGEIFIIL